MDVYKKIQLYQEAIKFELLEDYRQAFDLYLASAKQGYAKAQLAVAKYYLGLGAYKGIVRKNRAKAIEYLNLAESGGSAEAKYRLAVILLENGCTADTARALELLQDASDRQYFLATYELARCSYYGIGCKQNYNKALTLMGKAMYVYGESSQLECYNGMRKILTELKGLSFDRKKATGLSEDDWCLFNDLCNDLDVDD